MGAGRGGAGGAEATACPDAAYPSGAAIADANVQVRNVETGASQSATADSQGRYQYIRLMRQGYIDDNWIIIGPNTNSTSVPPT